MLAIYFAGMFLLSNFQNLAGQAAASNMTLSGVGDMEAWNKCEAECGGAEAYEKRERSGSFACFTLEAKESQTKHQTVECPCILECLEGGKPDDDQLKCFFELCESWKITKEYKSWIFFCPGYGQKHIEKNECDQVLSGKVKYHAECAEP